MLVLSRKENEVIDVGLGTLQIVIVEIRGDKVRLGIVASKDIPVHRKEIADEIIAGHIARLGSDANQMIELPIPVQSIAGVSN